MRVLLAFFSALLFFGCNTNETTSDKKTERSTLALYLQNKAPLKENPYLELPLGAIKPKAWLEDQLQRMANGMTGNLDSIYGDVVGKRNGWLGGDGDGWERGPYWIDGLLPLAYILNDEKLKEKVRPWVEWTLNNQAENGYLGPVPFKGKPVYEPGLQRGNRMDWWPKMVMLKILQQYYNATEDKRVITALTKYFKYQLQELPKRPLDYLSFWGNRRGGDNLQVVYWFYNITGDKFLLDLGKIIQEQTFPWTEVFLNTENNNDPSNPWYYGQMKRYPFDTTEIENLTISKIGGIHTVNLAQGIKEPVVAYQADLNQDHLKAVKKAFADIKKYHGQPQGMYGGDEPLHGNNPVQGIEFCAISEEMFSLETMLKITGDMEFADQLERITYNALPTQASDDYMSRQYFQAANQIELSDKLGTSFESNNHQHTDFVYGTTTGYPCCTTNMHQSWPKFVQNLFYATKNGGIAALQYAPSEVTMKVANGVLLQMEEKTGYPFRETVHFKMKLSKEAFFPFHLRIPEWAKTPSILINGREVKFSVENQIVVLERKWNNGDEITLKLPMELKISTWYQFTKTVERGPLVYSLKIDHRLAEKNRGDHFGTFTEVYPKTNWNMALLNTVIENPSENIKIVEKNWTHEVYPWNIENAPIQLELNGVQVDNWKAVNGVAVIPGFWGAPARPKDKLAPIVLIPYGCTTLRITEFPVYSVKN
ncbi:beta-L-arabinofuranosidase domain-containing protein [Galbibacter pacificus]|uniref:Glycoside hydrolase family 127 protein n=1 Tax=Galbibacter pacificus TaxID=2996052 RepID=A0ABT6FVW3_9FLAO|nr:beta-L-arabinofuranosidase domain-containing protein [Galbibacter pacificus]MDG3583855.1 glycoside hydrolase family 127 protein [Galbibacter pacificus]MDG3587227.1 glycoside hydrolase family 127 protein [Galbibacter pacificus]